MKKQFIILLILFCAQSRHAFCQLSLHGLSPQIQSCTTETDSLTNKLVYVTATVDPEPKGGINVLLRKMSSDLIIDFEIDRRNYDPHIIVAVIVGIDGKISGARVVKDKTNSIGSQMLKIAESFKWTPAKCDDKIVPMIYQITINYDPTDE